MFHFLPLILCSAVKQFKPAEDHQAPKNDQPQLGWEYESADRADSDDQQDQSEEFDFSGLPAADFSVKKIEIHSDHFL